MSKIKTETDGLLEQYKLYVQMADNISSRRSQTNAFYITVISALIAIQTLAAENYTMPQQYTSQLTVGILGILLCVTWYFNIQSYSQLNSGKFQIIHEMEEKLPFQCYMKEWELLGRGENGRQYLQLTRIEKIVPLLLILPFIFALWFGISGMLK